MDIIYGLLFTLILSLFFFVVPSIIFVSGLALINNKKGKENDQM